MNKIINEEPIISVIVPVYNVQDYLEQCLDSVINQSFTKLEILLVDDESTDNSGAICDMYEKKDKRIKVIHQKNTGSSGARNTGIDVSKGKYICFVDSDDILDKNMINELYDLLQETDSDISICGIKKFYQEKPANSNENSSYIKMNSTEAIEEMLYQKLFDTSPCGKLFDSNCVKNTYFPDNKNHEDLFTVYKYLYKAKNIVLTKKEMYYYRQHGSSKMHKDFNMTIFDEYEAIKEIETFIKESKLNISGSLQSRKFSTSCQILSWIPYNNDNDKVKQIRNELWNNIKNNRMNMLFDKKARIKNRIAALLSFLGFNAFYRIMLLKNDHIKMSVGNYDK